MTFPYAAFHPEAMREAQDDRAGAQRDAALERVKRAIERTQRIANAVHRTHGINLVDAQSYLEYAAEAVQSEAEA